MKNKKIVSLEVLVDRIVQYKKENKKVVLCHGCFDLLHIGHIRYFEAAKAMGDILIVTITPDEYVDKGPNRPAFTQQLRLEAIASLSVVDMVAVNEWKTAVPTLALLKPAIYVKGSDFQSVEADTTGKLYEEAEECKKLGIELRFTQDIVFSSSNLINRFLSSYPEEVQEYIQLFRSRYTLAEVLAWIAKMSELNVLLVGDAILDEYCYCSSLGKSSKYPTLAVLRGETDMFAGGVMAIANHIAGFVKHVDMITVLGDRESYQDFITDNLCSNITPHFIIKENSPTTLKKRYIEGYTFTKLLEVYTMNDSELSEVQELTMREQVMSLVSHNDMTLFSDFGHGTISQKLRDSLSESKAFFALNTQCNAGNQMLNTISQYNRADYVSISEGELRIDLRDRTTHVRQLTPAIAKKMQCKYFLATRGKKGACIGMADGSFVEVPAFTVKTIDTIGSGDALLAISSLAARVGAPSEIITFLGNVAGAIAVQTIGNATPVKRQELEKFITALLR